MKIIIILLNLILVINAKSQSLAFGYKAVSTSIVNTTEEEKYNYPRYGYIIILDSCYIIFLQPQNVSDSGYINKQGLGVILWDKSFYLSNIKISR